MNDKNPGDPVSEATYVFLPDKPDPLKIFRGGELMNAIEHIENKENKENKIKTSADSYKSARI